MKRAVIGVDEAGRGPLAGPVAVGVVLLPADFLWDTLPQVGDSKQLSPKHRALVNTAAHALAAERKLFFYVGKASAKEIDAKGIAVVIRALVAEGIAEVLNVAQLAPDAVSVKLDGALVAPSIYPYQQTIIKGDASEPEIGLASILAKEWRDAYMVQRSEEPAFAPYAFAQHKGYGTKVHRAAIAQWGCSREHRQTYCKNIKLL